MSEMELLRQIQIECSNLGARVFRNNTGMAWVGDVVFKTINSVRLENCRRFHGGLCVGSSDLIGWTKSGRFLAIEVKGPRGVVSADQSAFLKIVNSFGGLGIVARSLGDVREALNDAI